MPLLFQYLFKLSICITVVALFYQLVLRRLTFYNWNRWYLLAYSFLAFLIPFANVDWLLQKNELAKTGVVRYIPAVGQLGPAVTPSVQTTAIQFSGWDVLLVIMAAGTVFLGLRLCLQFLSYHKIRRQARLLYADGVHVYQVDKAIIPFSFGHSIFINEQLHTETELKEIIRHEFVHVKQKHTVDVIWSELFYLLNWYNPFAWMLRHAMRQNLEFIADQQVLQSGLNKKEYQYLLLKVMGSSGFRLANQFNFSSLKKRIVMMNKLKSSKVHLLKFLFVVPLVVVLLLAFRNATTKEAPEELVVTGLVVETTTYVPLPGVKVIDQISKLETVTDEKGYYKLPLPNATYPVTTDLVFSKEGFGNVSSGATLKAVNAKEAVAFIDMINMERLNNDGNIKGYSTMSVVAPFTSKTVPSYNNLKDMLDASIKNWKRNQKLEQLIKGSALPYWVVDGATYIVTKGGSFASLDEVSDIVFVNGQRSTGEEVNRTVQRESIISVSAISGDVAKTSFGTDKGVFEIWLQGSVADTIPKPPPPPPVELDAYDAFMYRNPGVKNLHWKKDSLYILFKNGKKEGYFLDKKGRQAVESKYGKLPIPPPPPPMPPKPEQPHKVTTYALHRNDGMTAEQQAFFKKHTAVELLYWKGRQLEIYRDGGNIETYNLSQKADLQTLQSRYGTLPEPAGASHKKVG